MNGQIQIKYSFKKELTQFFRTFKLLWIVLAIFGFALANPLMYKVSAMVFKELNNVQPTTTASVMTEPEETPGGGLLGDLGLGDITSMYSNAGTTYSMTLMSFAADSLLVILLVMMPIAGGEQKKRAMIVPVCSGLKNKNYLLPKFVIYPLAVFTVTFLGGLSAGGLCNMLADNGSVSIGMIALGSLFISIYLTFIVTVYLSLGLCTSRPGIMAGAVFLGQLFLQSMLEGMGLSDYQPFTLATVVGSMFYEGYDLSENMPSILTSIGLSVVIGVLMFFLALGVLNAKKIDNQEEEKPVF